MKYKYSTPVLFEICDIGDFHEQEVEFQQSSLGFEIEYVQAHGWVWLADRTWSMANRRTGASSSRERKHRAALEEEESSARTSASDKSKDDNNNWASNRDNDGIL
jgi:hypothetical protein